MTDRTSYKKFNFVCVNCVHTRDEFIAEDTDIITHKPLKCDKCEKTLMYPNNMRACSRMSILNTKKINSIIKKLEKLELTITESQ